MRLYCQWCQRSGPMLLSHKTEAGTVLLHKDCKPLYVQQSAEVAREVGVPVAGEVDDQ